MKELLIYALGVTVCSGVFVAFYLTILRRHTTFRTARFYLVASLLTAAVIPALDIPVWKAAQVEVAQTPQPIATREIEQFGAVSVFDAVTPVDWSAVSLWVLYGMGIAVLTAAMARQIARIARVKRRAEIIRTGDCEIAVSDEVDAPFSFLDTVFIERGTPEDEVRQIVLHETSHIRHRHSREKIAMEALKNVLWFNPFGWWAASLLTEVHEFEADRDVLNGGFSVEEYLPLIFRRTFGYIPELSVGLGNSLTKKRFLMMKNSVKPTKYSRLMVAGVLPLAAGMLALFSFTSLPPEIVFIETPAAEEPVVEPAVEVVSAMSAETYKSDSPATKRASEARTQPEERRSMKVMVRNDRGRVIQNTAPLLLSVEGSGEVQAFDESGNTLVDVARGDRVSLLAGSNIYKIPVADFDSMLVKYRGKSGRNTRRTDNTPLHKIVDAGYGTVTERENTSSVNKIESDENYAYGSLKEHIQGRVPGVYFMGDILTVRGITSINGSDALVIVDGVPVGSFAAVNASLSPQSIASVSVLKDAGSTGIYGARGANGVVLITTKNGMHIK